MSLAALACGSHVPACHQLIQLSWGGSWVVSQLWVYSPTMPCTRAWSQLLQRLMAIYGNVLLDDCIYDIQNHIKPQNHSTVFGGAERSEALEFETFWDKCQWLGGQSQKHEKTMTHHDKPVLLQNHQEGNLERAEAWFVQLHAWHD